jgi:hypothetical protein
MDNSINNLARKKELASDVVELGTDKILVGYEEMKNKVVVPRMEKDEALEHIAKEFNVKKIRVERLMEENKFMKSKFNNLVKKSNHLNISLPIAIAVTAYARISIYKYKEQVGLAGGDYYTIRIRIAFLLRCPYLITLLAQSLAK